MLLLFSSNFHLWRFIHFSFWSKYTHEKPSIRPSSCGYAIQNNKSMDKSKHKYEFSK